MAQKNPGLPCCSNRSRCSDCRLDWQSFPTASYRYRLTIAVEFDGKVHSGSSVIEVWYRFFPHWAAALSNGSQFDYAIQGEAVVIDLDNGGVLIAALGYNRDRSTVPAVALAARAFDPAARRLGPGYPATLAKVQFLSRVQGRVDLTVDNMPPFIWFADETDPRSARLVKPDDMAAVIGDAARLVSAQVEITRDPIVIDIDKRLPLYKSLPPPPNSNSISLPNGLVLNWSMFIGPGSVQ